MINPTFPKVQEHNDVFCFNCGSDGELTKEPKRSEYPYGRGQYKQVCRKCTMTTWYDLKQKEAA